MNDDGTDRSSVSQAQLLQEELDGRMREAQSLALKATLGSLAAIVIVICKSNRLYIYNIINID